MRRQKDEENDGSMLRDGEARRIPLMMKDSTDARRGEMQRQFQRLHDGRGGTPGRRPGFVLADRAANDQRQAAYAEYEDSLKTAWRNDAAADGTSRTVSGEPTQSTEGRLDRNLTIDALYAAYDAELREAWRTR